MLKNYLTSAFRHFLTGPLYSLVSILGLAVGLTSCLIIGLYVDYELGFDTDHEHGNAIYRIIREASVEGRPSFTDVTSAGLGPILGAEIPSVTVARVKRERRHITIGDQELPNFVVCRADPGILDVFTLPLISGRKDDVLATPASALITLEAAERLFGTHDVVGQTFKIVRDAYEITGILANPPERTSIPFDIITPPDRRPSNRWALWHRSLVKRVETFIHIQDGHLQTVSDQLARLTVNHLGSDAGITYHFQPLSRIHLYTASDGISSRRSDAKLGDIRTLYLLSLVAVFTLVIAIANVINLGIARGSARYKEVGVRKAVGATRRQLLTQHLGESIGSTALSCVLSLILTFVLLPTVNQLLDRNLTFDIVRLLPLLITLVLVVGILNGLYPGLVLSARPSAMAAKGATTVSGSSRYAWSLVVIQFTLAIGLMTATWATREQHAFLRDMKLGIDQENVLILPLFDATNGNGVINGYRFKQRYAEVKSAFLAHPRILKATTSRGTTGIHSEGSSFIAEGGIQNAASVFPVDEDYLSFYKIELLAGRNFQYEHARTTNTWRRDHKATERFIINEKAMALWGWTLDPGAASYAVGKVLSANVGGSFFPDGLRRGVVIGVVKDFHFSPLRETVGPLVLVTEPSSMANLYLKIVPEDLTQTLAFAKSLWERYVPNRPFQYSFLDERLDRLYDSEARLTQAFTLFTTVSILIACLGLFSLSALEVSKRAKEIGIRKVLGASLPGLIALLAQRHLKLVTIAGLIATPIGYGLVEQWLQNFPYRIQLGFTPFVAFVGAGLLLAATTVIYQTTRAALSDPVDTLRAE